MINNRIESQNCLKNLIATIYSHCLKGVKYVEDARKPKKMEPGGFF